MCRLLIILSRKSDECIPYCRLKNVLWFEEHALFKQCYKPPYTPGDEGNPNNHHLNLDGYGIGYFIDGVSCSYHSTYMSWNDVQFQQMLRYIKTCIFLGHIRSIETFIDDPMHIFSLVHQFNCHPFIHKRWMFAHNGDVSPYSTGIGRKKIICHISDDLIIRVKGTTDSEHLFYLILTELLKEEGISDEEVGNAVVRTMKFLISLGGISIINFMLTDGNRCFVLRYSTDKSISPPSMYWTSNDKEIVVVSEPIDRTSKWTIVKPSVLHVARMDDDNLIPILSL